MSKMDVVRVRNDTPALCYQPGNSASTIHLDGALLPYQVTDAIKAHADREAVCGPQHARAAAQKQVESTYDAVAALLSCQRDEVNARSRPLHPLSLSLCVYIYICAPPLLLLLLPPFARCCLCLCLSACLTGLRARWRNEQALRQ